MLVSRLRLWKGEVDLSTQYYRDLMLILSYHVIGAINVLFALQNRQVCVGKNQWGIRLLALIAKTARLRVSQHVADMRSTRSSNLREHNQEYHDGKEPTYKYEVVKRFRGDPLGRQLDEAIRIDTHVGISLNDKGEWVRPAGVRIHVEKR